MFFAPKFEAKALLPDVPVVKVAKVFWTNVGEVVSRLMLASMRVKLLLLTQVGQAYVMVEPAEATVRGEVAAQVRAPVRAFAEFTTTSQTIESATVFTNWFAGQDWEMSFAKMVLEAVRKSHPIEVEFRKLTAPVNVCAPWTIELTKALQTKDKTPAASSVTWVRAFPAEQAAGLDAASPEPDDLTAELFSVIQATATT